MPESSLLNTRALRVLYGGVVALDSVDIDVRAGAITGIVGPNGSGKSTLVGAISGEVPAAAGEINFKGERVTRMGTAGRVRAGIARTFQVPRFPPELSVGDVLEVAELYSKRRKSTTARGTDRTNEVATLCGLQDELTTSCASLTVPELRRLELARALCCSPEVIMLDEIMAGLGNAEIDESMSLVRSVARENVTVIIVEHMVRVMRQLCDELIVLDHGSLIAGGSPDKVLSDSRVVGAYLGEL